MAVSRSPSPEKSRETLPLASDQPRYGTDGAGRTYAHPTGEAMVQIPASLLNEMMALAARGAGVPEQESTIEFQDGTQYSGAVRDGKPHGRGTLQFKGNPTCQKFEGVFHLGSMRQGKMNFTNGDRYEGEFENNRPHGQGRYFFAKGDIYSGQFTHGMITGRGKYTHLDGSTYEGMVMNNKYHGQGVRRWPNGDVYSGNFVNDEIEGQGTLTEIGPRSVWTKKGIFHKGRLWNGDLEGGGNGISVVYQGKIVFEGFIRYEQWAAQYLSRQAISVPGGVPSNAYHDECLCTLV